jgi:hypothetical protein
MRWDFCGRVKGARTAVAVDIGIRPRGTVTTGGIRKPARWRMPWRTVS